jgi:hypothetical protein
VTPSQPLKSIEIPYGPITNSPPLQLNLSIS